MTHPKNRAGVVEIPARAAKTLSAPALGVLSYLAATRVREIHETELAARFPEIASEIPAIARELGGLDFQILRDDKKGVA